MAYDLAVWSTVHIKLIIFLGCRAISILYKDRTLCFSLRIWAGMVGTSILVVIVPHGSWRVRVTQRLEIDVVDVRLDRVRWQGRL